MLIIPELETVLILVPRTGSGSLRRAVQARYPQSILLYRHMEADGVPAGYDRWDKVGFIRNPLDRLWSLYKFMRSYANPAHDEAYCASMRQSAAVPFERWLVENMTPFTSPYDSAGHGRYWPNFTVRHPLPENRKSQMLYLRPDLGTRVYAYEDLSSWAHSAELDLDRHNKTEEEPCPTLVPRSPAAYHMERWFAWDTNERMARWGLE